MKRPKEHAWVLFHKSYGSMEILKHVCPCGTIRETRTVYAKGKRGRKFVRVVHWRRILYFRARPLKRMPRPSWSC